MMLALKNVLVATDFSDASDAALRYGRTFALMFGATLHVLHVTENVFLEAIGSETYLPVVPDLQLDVNAAAQKRLDAVLVDSDGRGPVTRKVLRTSSAPAQEITEYAAAEAIDLIVIGTHGRGGVVHVLMGSVAERVVRTAPCPVLTVRHPERDFVVPEALAVPAKTI
jgi:nucleotide-binding universal stress UspA family protein